MPTLKKGQQAYSPNWPSWGTSGMSSKNFVCAKSVLLGPGRGNPPPHPLFSSDNITAIATRLRGMILCPKVFLLSSAT